MYIYNLTAVIEAKVYPKWVDWVRSTYMPKVKMTQKIEQLRFFKILNNDAQISIAIHHQTQNPKNLLDFVEVEIPDLTQLCYQQFADNVLLFGTELKEISIEN